METVVHEGSEYGERDAILWGSHNSSTRILWDGPHREMTVWGNLGAMPVSEGTFEKAKALAASWELTVFDAEKNENVREVRGDQSSVGG